MLETTSNGGLVINRSGIRGTDLCCKRGHLVEATANRNRPLEEEGQYAEIKVTQGSIGAEQIKADAAGQEGGGHLQ